MGNFQELSDLNKTVKISARRFEESPYIERTNSPDMVRGVYAGRYFPMSIGEDPIQKYWLLRQKALIFDVPEKPVEISGPDSLAFLDKVTTRKLSNIKVGRGYYTLACTPQGGIFMDGVIFKFNDEKFWFVQADGPFEDWLLAHSSNYNVKISDPKSRVLQIQGPASIDIMKAASKGKIDEKTTDRFGEEEIVFVTLIYCDTGIENCYCFLVLLWLLCYNKRISGEVMIFEFFYYSFIAMVILMAWMTYDDVRMEKRNNG